MPRGAYHRWTATEDTRIKTEYPTCHPASMAKELCVSTHALRQRAALLGVAKNNGTRLHAPKGTVTGSWLERGYRVIHISGVGAVLEHRYIMSKFLRRPLKQEEVVHHMNGDKLDNRIRNLRVFPNEASHWQWHREHPEIGSPNPRRVMRTPIEGCLLCTGCGETKQVAEFNTDKGRASGYSQYCRACLKTKNQDYHQRRKARNASKRA